MRVQLSIGMQQTHKIEVAYVEWYVSVCRSSSLEIDELQKNQMIKIKYNKPVMLIQFLVSYSFSKKTLCFIFLFFLESMDSFRPLCPFNWIYIIILIESNDNLENDRITSRNSCFSLFEFDIVDKIKTEIWREHRIVRNRMFFWPYEMFA